MTKFYAQEAYENGFKEGIAHGQHLRDSERQSQSDRIKELEAELKTANERNKQFERFLKEKNYINFYEAWEHRILGGNKNG